MRCLPAFVMAAVVVASATACATAPAREIEMLGRTLPLGRISEGFNISQGFWPCGPYIVGDSTVVEGVPQRRLVFMVIDQENDRGTLSFWLWERTQIRQDATRVVPTAAVGRMGQDTVAVITISPEGYGEHLACLAEPKPRRRRVGR